MTEKAQTTFSVLAFAVSLVAAAVSAVSLYNQFYRTEKSGWVFTNSVQTPNSVSDTSLVLINATFFNNGSGPIIMSGPVLYTPHIKMSGLNGKPDSVIHVRWADRNTRVMTSDDNFELDPSSAMSTNMRKRVVMPMERMDLLAVSNIDYLYGYLDNLDSTRFNMAVFDIKASFHYQVDTTIFNAKVDVNKFIYSPSRQDYVGFMPGIGKSIKLNFDKSIAE